MSAKTDSLVSKASLLPGSSGRVSVGKVAKAIKRGSFCQLLLQREEPTREQEERIQ